MSGSDVFNFLVLAAVVAYLALEIRHRRRRASMFLACAERLGLRDFTHTQSSIAGKLRGLPVDVHFVAGTKNTPSHTTIDLTFSPCPLLLDLRRQDADEERTVRRGEAVDLTLDDPAFDAAWIVEGAPAERVLRVLASPTLRGRLLAFAQLPRPSVKIEDGRLSLYREGSEVGAEGVATERIELAAALAEAVIADAGVPLEPGEVDPAAGYRTADRADAEASGAAKVAELKRMRAARAVGQLRIAGILASSLFTALIVGFQLMSELPPIFFTVPLLLMAVLVTSVIASSYRAERRSAPGLPHDALMIGWMAVSWAINLALAVRAIAIF